MPEIILSRAIFNKVGNKIMDFKTVESKDNDLIKQVARLQASARERREQGLFVAEGLRICEDCFDNNVLIKTLIVTKTFYNKFEQEAEKISEKADETVVVNDGVFAKISDTKSPQGILAVCRIPQKNTVEIKKDGKYIALENLSDPSNLGAVARTAEALGIDGIILSSDSVDPFSPKALRASMGTLVRLPIIVLEDFCNELKSSGLALFACVVRNGKSINGISFKKGSIVLIGNEANGLTTEAQSIAKNITIPMKGNAESLNLAVAASIAMWELMK